LHSSNQQYEAASSKNLAKKAETIENTRKTVDILIGAACHQAEPKKISARKAQKFQRLPGFLRPIFEVGKKDIKKGFGKISGLEPLPTRFWAAFPGIFRESGSFLLSAKCRISTGVFVGLAEHPLQAQIPTR